MGGGGWGNFHRAGAGGPPSYAKLKRSLGDLTVAEQAMALLQ